MLLMLPLMPDAAMLLRFRFDAAAFFHAAVTP